jgi:hypothetical protein
MRKVQDLMGVDAGSREFTGVGERSDLKGWHGQWWTAEGRVSWRLGRCGGARELSDAGGRGWWFGQWLRAGGLGGQEEEHEGHVW